jgi:hypothetical protein
MLIKLIKIFLLSAAFIITCALPVIFFPMKSNDSVSQETLSREPSIPINAVIGEAMTIYASAPYHRFSREELQNYFSAEIVEMILKNYEPFSNPGEETVIVFEEQPFPEIKVTEIRQENGEYEVKLQFGEVFYNYRLTVSPNRRITKIVEGGVSF